MTPERKNIEKKSNAKPVGWIRGLTSGAMPFGDCALRELARKINLSPLLVIAGIATGMPFHSIEASSHEGGTTQPQPDIQKETHMVQSVTPREMLMRIKSAIDQGLFLYEDFYEEKNLKRFFGEHFTFRSHNDESGLKQFFFNDSGNVYVDEKGNLTPLGRTRPCIKEGTIFFRVGRNGDKAMASLALNTLVRISSSTSFYADLVYEIFGTPISVTEGYPSAPPLHGRPYIPGVKTNDLGNSWIHYGEKDVGAVKKIMFRTLGDAEIIEIQISVGEK